MPSIKVLAIDGGGIRGIIPAVILAEIQTRLGMDLFKAFDLIAGTSTGGIIALGIGTACKNTGPYSPGELLDLYVQNGPAIFRKNILTPERQLFLPKYGPDALESALEQFFGDAEFRSALTPLLISSYDLQGQIPFFFKSHKIASDPTYNWQLTDIARATSAAPTFFPPLHLTRGAEDYALVDGGVFVNNPSMAAYAEARSLYPQALAFSVVSVGTGDRDLGDVERGHGHRTVGGQRLEVRAPDSTRPDRRADRAGRRGRRGGLAAGLRGPDGQAAP